MTSIERAKEFCALHNRDLSSLVDEALEYWLDTCGEVLTEELAAGSKDLN